MQHTIEIKKVSTFCIMEIIRTINVFAAGLTEPTNTNKFKFDLSSYLWQYFNKKVNKTEVPAKHKVKLKVFEAIFLLEIINTVAELEHKPATLYTIKESIDKQLIP